MLVKIQWGVHVISEAQGFFISKMKKRVRLQFLLYICPRILSLISGDLNQIVVMMNQAKDAYK